MLETRHWTIEYNCAIIRARHIDVNDATTGTAHLHSKLDMFIHVAVASPAPSLSSVVIRHRVCAIIFYRLL